MPSLRKQCIKLQPPATLWRSSSSWCCVFWFFSALLWVGCDRGKPANLVLFFLWARNHFNRFVHSFPSFLSAPSIHLRLLHNVDMSRSLQRHGKLHGPDKVPVHRPCAFDTTRAKTGQQRACVT